MSSIQKVQLLIAVILSCVLCVRVNGDAGEVIELNDANFFSATAVGEWFVEYYAPWVR